MSDLIDPLGSTAAARPRPPLPTSISDEARRMLAMEPFAPPPFPDGDDTEAWLGWVETLDGIAAQMFTAAMPTSDELTHTSINAGGVEVHVLTRPDPVVGPGEGSLFIDVHGGGLVLGGGALSWREAVRHAKGRAGTTWAPDYRMPPLAPYPAALDDMLTVYRHALEQREPRQIVVLGTSAGGNLAAALMLRAKDEGLPMPAALVLLSPHVDLTESGDSFATNFGVDPVLTTSLRPASLLYAGDRDLAHPYLSPLFGDLRGLPPTFLQTGTRDLFLSNTVRMHRRLRAAGVSAELHVFEAMPHTAFTGTAPEDDEVRAEIRRFELEHLA